MTGKTRLLKQKYKKWLLPILILISTLFILISSFKIIRQYLDDKNTNKQLDQITNVITIEEKEGNNEGYEIIEQEEPIEQFNPYWDFIKMNLIDVDFDKLKEINKDVKGWIQVKGTNINYPFVQTNNNTDYLNYTFDKSFNTAGWIFLDYRNDLSEDDKNTIIYGHGRINQIIMFGSLRNILTSGWLNDPLNHVIKLSTKYENTLWQVFSVYHIPTTSDYIQTDFKSEREYKTFVNMLLNRSAYNFNTNVASNDRILTLSTCYNSTEKVVLHAKLIKREVK